MSTIRVLFRALLLTALGCAPIYAGQVANYDFQDTLASTGAVAPNLVDLGSGSYIDDVVVGQSCRVFDFAVQTGFSLDVTGLFGAADYTFVAMMRLEEVDSYAKILDVRDRVIDEGLYAEDFDLLFYDYSNLDLGQLSSDTWAQIALSFDGTTLRGYVNGVLAFEEDDTDTVGAITSSTLYFFRDDLDTSDSENSAGRVANIQLFDEALNGGAIAALSFSCGANAAAAATASVAPVPTMPIYGLVLTILGALLLAGRSFRLSSRRY